MKKSRITAAALLLLFCLFLTACGGKTPGSPAPSPAASEAPAAEAAPSAAPEEAVAQEEPAQEEPAAPEAVVESAEEPGVVAEPDASMPVRVMTLNGTTGFGLAGLIAESNAGNTAQNYSFTVETDASNVTAALVNGSCDIAALPTNAASALYNKTEGGVQALALNTRGVLYVLSDGTVPVESFADLNGQTVYVPAQNPSFIFGFLCSANDISVSIDNTYAQPAELNAAVAAGQVHLAVLPEPMVTVACSQNNDLQIVLDLTEEWDRVAEPGSLVQGCVVVRTEFVKEHPEEVLAFLKDYEASVDLLTDDPAAAAQKIEETGIFSKAAVAQKAIPHCNICFVTGAEMQAQLSAFLEIMAETVPQSIGGAVPGPDFYCILQ